MIKLKIFLFCKHSYKLESQWKYVGQITGMFRKVFQLDHFDSIAGYLKQKKLSYF